MKVEMGERQLRIVGKGWQVQAWLRQYSRQQLTLDELLRRQQSIRHRSLSIVEKQQPPQQK